MFLNNQYVTKVIKREIKKFIETNDNKNTTTQNLCSKTVLRGEFIEIQSYLKKQEKHWIDNLILQLKQLEKEQQKPQISRRKVIVKIRAEINEKEIKETLVKLTKTIIWFFEKINKIDKYLARLIKKKKERTINSRKLEMKKGRLQ